MVDCYSRNSDDNHKNRSDDDDLFINRTNRKKRMQIKIKKENYPQMSENNRWWVLHNSSCQGAYNESNLGLRLNCKWKPVSLETPNDRSNINFPSTDMPMKYSDPHSQTTHTINAGLLNNLHKVGSNYNITIPSACGGRRCAQQTNSLEMECNKFGKYANDLIDTGDETLHNYTSYKQLCDKNRNGTTITNCVNKNSEIPSEHIKTSQQCRKLTNSVYLKPCSHQKSKVHPLYRTIYSNSSFVKWLMYVVLFAVLISSADCFELKPTTLLSKEAMVGRNVSLPCEFPYLPENPVLILWYKNQNTRPFYSYDARKEIGSQHKVHDKSDVGSRATFAQKSTLTYATKHIVGNLLINNITLDDAGNFTCRVDFQKAQTAMALLQLEVHDPIWRVSVVDVHERDVGRETAPYEEGTRLYLTCRAFGGYPLPTVHWLSDDEIIASSAPPTEEYRPLRNRWKNRQILTPEMEVEAVLQLPVLKREDQGRIFTCQANNSKLTPMRTKIIKLNMALKPLHVEIEGPSKPLWSGEEAEFQCRSWGSRPAAKLLWGPNSLLKTLKHQTSLDENTTISRVQLIPTPEDDGLSINCTAVNPLVRAYKISAYQNLVVYYAPQVSVVLASFLKPDNIKEGDDVYFECKVKANPTPRALIWLHQGNVIKEDRDRGIIVQSHNLVLQGISRESRGKFQCKVSNDVATVTSQPVYLHIKFIPECSVSSQNNTVPVSEDEEVLLNCSVVSFPEPTEFIWRLNGTNGWQNIDPNKISSKGLTSSFSYTSKKRTPSSIFGEPQNAIFESSSLNNNLRSDSASFSPSNYYERLMMYRGDDPQTPRYMRTRSKKPSRSSGKSTGPRTSRSDRRGGGIYDTYNREKHQISSHMFPSDSYGVVYCLAKNSVGKQKDPCIFHISPAGPPENLASCSFVNHSASALRVACKPGHDGGLKQSFRAMVLDESTRNVVLNVTSQTPEFYLKGVAPSKAYLVILTAFNSKGSSKPYVLEGFDLKVAENKIKDENGSNSAPLLKMFAGALAVFFVIASVLIIVTRARYKRRRHLANIPLNDKQIPSGEKDMAPNEYWSAASQHSIISK